MNLPAVEIQNSEELKKKQNKKSRNVEDTLFYGVSRSHQKKEG